MVSEYYYHIFNRGVDHRPTFTSKKEYERAMLSAFYYRNIKPPVKYSNYLKFSSERRSEFLKDFEKRNEKLVEFVSYSFMPNHFHFLLKQVVDNGIVKFMSNFQNSYTKYFNIRNERTGPLFTGNFKSVLVESDSQLIHLTRYIHVNTYASGVVNSLEDLITYPWSSLPEYLGLSKDKFCEKGAALGKFKNVEKYKEFVFDNADYQKKLKLIKYLALE